MIKKIILIFTFLVLPVFSSAQVSIFIKFKPNITKAEVQTTIKNAYLNENSLSKMAYFPLLKPDSRSYLNNNIGLKRIFKVNFNNLTEKTDFLAKLDMTKVEYVQDNVTYKIDFIPDDSLVNKQWYLKKIGAYGAWDKVNENKDLKDVLVGVIDTGIDDKHPDLKEKIYINSGEIGIDKNGNDKRNNGIDDDENGFIDDYRGFDFVDRSIKNTNDTTSDFYNWDNNPSDENGHGTSVAGIIGAEINNKIGIAGIASNVRLLNLRAFDADGYGDDDDIASAIIYAVDNGAKVINMSFGDSKFSNLLKDVINYAVSRGVVLVGSSGNSSSDLPHYPSSFSSVISVGATDSSDFAASFSNSGSTLDLVAPGVDILTTSKDGKYRSFSGTSAAAPFVTGAVGILLGLKDLSAQEITQILKTTAKDINSPGWDETTGAGRLDLNKAVNSLLPAVIKINFPYQDFATSGDPIIINASVLSPNFESFKLEYGTGFNPTNWTEIRLTNNVYQFLNDNIDTLDVSSFSDTVYTIRLSVLLNSSKIMEERVNFYIDRTPPEISLINGGTVLFGDKATILAAIYTNEKSVVKMFYKLKGTEKFSSVTLDDFDTNIGTVTRSHYGYIPLEIVRDNSKYDVYFEAENLAGLKTILNDNGNSFEFSTESNFNLASFDKLQYTLPEGRVYKEPVSITSNNKQNVLINEISNNQILSIYDFQNGSFTKIDSLQDRIPKSFGDFNKNNKVDMLGLFLRFGFIDEQSDQFSSNFENNFSDSSGNFWPALADDIDGDGKTEIISFAQDSTFSISEVNNDLSVSLESMLPLSIYSNTDSQGFIGAPNVVVDDINNDGKKEIWFMNNRGILTGYTINGPNSYSAYKNFNFKLNGIKNAIASGDYNGDGKHELAVLLKSITKNDISPFYLLVIFNIENNELNIISSKAFMDISSTFSSGFTRRQYNVTFADIDNDGKEELLINVFPYFYILKNNDGLDNVIFYKTNINTTTVFTGDLNKDGVKEFGITENNSTNFYELKDSSFPVIATIKNVYSIDSSHIKLEFGSISGKYYLFRGLKPDNLNLYDSSNFESYIDSAGIRNNTMYYYSIKTIGSGNPLKESTQSSVVSVFAHAPAEAKSADVISSKQIKITFSNKIKNYVNELSNFKFIVKPANDILVPKTIFTSSQFSYILNFDNNLPVGEHQLEIGKSLKDLYNSPIPGKIFNVTVQEERDTSKGFYITRFQILKSNKIRVILNLNLDKTSAQNKSNYSFSPFNEITNIYLDINAENSVLLITKYPVGSIGKEYRLSLSNIFSSESSGHIKIANGAGSTIVLLSSSENLNDVYVYPNPVRLEKTKRLTFANLTQRAEIIIFNINGRKIKSLIEENGDGGYSWDLRDENNRFINSGIYIFKVRALDNSNNIVEEKIGKFAVTR